MVNVEILNRNAVALLPDGADFHACLMRAAHFKRAVLFLNGGKHVYCYFSRRLGISYQICARVIVVDYHAVHVHLHRIGGGNVRNFEFNHRSARKIHREQFGSRKSVPFRRIHRNGKITVSVHRSHRRMVAFGVRRSPGGRRIVPSVFHIRRAIVRYRGRFHHVEYLHGNRRFFHHAAVQRKGSRNRTFSVLQFLRIDGNRPGRRAFAGIQRRAGTGKRKPLHRSAFGRYGG